MKKNGQTTLQETLFLNDKSLILCLSSTSSLRKSINKSLLASVPNNFLNPKSVYGFIYFDMFITFFTKIGEFTKRKHENCW